MKTLTVNSVVVNDPTTGDRLQFIRGHVFDDDDPILKQMGDHCFAVPEAEEIVMPDLEELTVRELLGICEDLQIDPTSNRKKDLIAQIRSHIEV